MSTIPGPFIVVGAMFLIWLCVIGWIVYHYREGHPKLALSALRQHHEHMRRKGIEPLYDDDGHPL